MECVAEGGDSSAAVMTQNEERSGGPTDGNIQAEADSKIAILPEEKKIYICRYGSGCTHMKEKEHMSLFWHPPVPKLDKQTLRTHYICNECGQAFLVLQDLQQHLQRKTAWSNKSLIRARLNVFIEGRSWQEGIVTSFRGGKHHIHFYLLGEKRWVNMAKALFYIIYQPNEHQLSARRLGEVKEDDDASSEEEDDEWLYVENITLDYAFTQSVLFKVYGSSIQETGYRTRGHHSLTEADRKHALHSKGSFLYGEFLPRGVDKALRENRLNAASARTLYDLGMGIGKVVMQAFLQFRNLVYVYGVELSHGRFRIAEEAALRMVDLLGKSSFTVEHVPGKSIMIVERDLDAESPDSDAPSPAGAKVYGDPLTRSGATKNPTAVKKRVLHMVQGDLLDTPHVQCADIVMLETDFPAEIHPDLCDLLSKLKHGARTLTYLDLRKLFGDQKNPTFRQLDINKPPTDRYPTSWSMQRGHRFYLWKKATRSTVATSPPKKAKSASKRKAADGSSSLSSSVMPHSAVDEDGDATSRISKQIDLSELAVSDAEEQSNQNTRTSGRISSFFSNFFSKFKRNTGPEGDRRVVPLKDTYEEHQKPLRRHSRGHTDDSPGISRDDFHDPDDFDVSETGGEQVTARELRESHEWEDAERNPDIVNCEDAALSSPSATALSSPRVDLVLSTTGV